MLYFVKQNFITKYVEKVFGTLFSERTIIRAE